MDTAVFPWWYAEDQSMNISAVTVIVFVILIGGALLGAGIRNVLQGEHFDEGSRQVITLGTGLLGTLAALVLGLLIASAKNSYDAQLTQVRQVTSDVVLIDLLLAQYGPQAHEARMLLRRATDAMVGKIWQENGSEAAVKGPFTATAAGEQAFATIQALAPENDAQRAYKNRALDVGTDLIKARTLLFEQAGPSIPMPFLAVLVFWLTIIFMSFTLFARLNSTVIVVLVVLALSVSGAIFLLLGMSEPFTGPIQISSDPLRNALAPLGA
jgi:hypothetical protein